MLNPSIGKLISRKESRYAIVIAVAKRAREIAEQNEESEIQTVEKPVDIALDEIAGGKYSIANVG